MYNSKFIICSLVRDVVDFICNLKFLKPSIETTLMLPTFFDVAHYFDVAAPKVTVGQRSLIVVTGFVTAEKLRWMVTMTANT